MRRPGLTATPLVVLASLACGGSGPGWGAVSPAGNETRVWEATARFVITHYDPSDWIGAPAAFCLVVGRREHVARRQQSREPSWDPPPLLLGRLADVGTPVVPISQCRWNDELQEIHLPTGRPAVVLGISQPTWSTSEYARVRVTTRENSAYAFSYSCRVRRGLDSWEILDCV